MSCPCGLTREIVIDLYQRNLFPLIGGKCQNPLADGSDGVCGRALGAHPFSHGGVWHPFYARMNQERVGLFEKGRGGV